MKNVISTYQNLSLGVINVTDFQVSSLIIVSVAFVSWLIEHFGITDYSTDLNSDDLWRGMIHSLQGKVELDSCETLLGRFPCGGTKDSSLVQIGIFLFFLKILIFRG